MKVSSSVAVIALVAITMIGMVSASTISTAIRRTTYTNAACTTGESNAYDGFEAIGTCTPFGGSKTDYASYLWSFNATSGLYTRQGWSATRVCGTVGDAANTTVTMTLGDCVSYGFQYAKYALINNTVDGTYKLVQSNMYPSASCAVTPFKITYENSGVCNSIYIYTITGASTLKQQLWLSGATGCSGNADATNTITEGQCLADSEDNSAGMFKFTGNSGMKTGATFITVALAMIVAISNMW